MRYLITLSISLFLLGKSYAQDATNFKFKDGHELELSGRVYNSALNYHRLDSGECLSLPKRVRELARNSAGLKLEWRLAKFVQSWNMTPLVINGLDLYGMKNGSWQYVASARPTAADNSVLLVKNLDGELRDYKLYLPLYSEITQLRVGVNPEATLEKPSPNAGKQKRVVIYGSSITQGASASRPGMAYPSILSRKTGIEMINLGFSGSGKMEPEVVDILANIPADAYVLDCVPNPLPSEIKERAFVFIQRLRALKPNVPVIMVESIFRETGNWDSVLGERTRQQNLEFRNAYNKLKKENSRNLYYIESKDLIGNDHEATVDGTHLSDLGFTRIAETIMKQLKRAL
ncbi:SGNH/GDSL hydrolase family protein [Pedobacter sp. SYSU D00535]|uniref:SGNH/GDSL hydrolase family protein n=1 Tax=Pedobacter sp. SYSU D00535 TaxID=2810308 RepID=UPI001A96EC17|nr:SGNH/GDSL hydrolase family protein [Pedobacter sp. SYSU D00535]